MRVAGIPGFEFTGEFREPLTGEWFWSDGQYPFQRTRDTKHPDRLILRRLRSTDLGDYELTGEVRAAEDDEPYLGYDGLGAVVRFGGFENTHRDGFYILRERPGGKPSEGAG